MPPADPPADTVNDVDPPPESPVERPKSPRGTKHERETSERHVERFRIENDRLRAEVEALHLRNAVLTQEVSRLWWTSTLA